MSPSTDASAVTTVHWQALALVDSVRVNARGAVGVRAIRCPPLHCVCGA
jgi:hypothetical protein